MIDIKRLRDNPDETKKLLARKNVPPEKVDAFLTLDKTWRELIQKIDAARNELNTLSKDRKVEEAKKVKQELKAIEEQLPKIEAERDASLEHFPNPPFPDVIEGKSDADNKTIREVGEKPSFDGWQAKDYLTLGESLDLIDVERAGKIAGSRFGYIKRELVLLEFALVQLALETAIKEGFIPVIPPIMLKPEMLKAMGKLKFMEDKDAFFLAEDNLYLAGSAEHTIGPMHAEETFKEKDLPRRYIGFSTCFRREAGSYGKDTKGILRVHQFDKVELFSFTKPEDSENEHKLLLSIQEKLMQALKIPYRVVEVCTGDMGFGDARQWDIEAWLPGQNKYRETHSTSNTTDYQARGLNTKYRKSDGKTEYLHTLNGTAFAIGRTLIAIIENYQTKEGSIRIPNALSKYLSFKEIKKADQER